MKLLQDLKRLLKRDKKVSGENVIVYKLPDYPLLTVRNKDIERTLSEVENRLKRLGVRR